MVAVSAASASAYAHRPQATMLKRGLEQDSSMPSCVSTWHEPATTVIPSNVTADTQRWLTTSQVMDSDCAFCDALSTAFRYHLLESNGTQHARFLMPINSVMSTEHSTVSVKPSPWASLAASAFSGSKPVYLPSSPATAASASLMPSIWREKKDA
jgi:hypothetical protein